MSTISKLFRSNVVGRGLDFISGASLGALFLSASSLAAAQSAAEGAQSMQAEAAPPAPAVVLVEPTVQAAAVDATTPVPAPAGAGSPPDEWWDEHPVATEEQAWVPGEGLEFTSKDDLFALAIRLRAQFLYQVERGYDAEASERTDPKQNLTIRRARVVFAGHMWGEKTQYKVELAVSPADLGMTQLSDTDNPPILSNRENYPSRSLLLDWYVQFSQVRDFNFRVGQWKVPYSRERVISSGNLQFVDRSLTNQEFNLDRDIGIEARSKDLFGWDGRLRYYAGVYNGDGHSQYELNDFGLMYLGRLEFLPLGKFEDYSEAHLVRGKPGISIGAAYARLENAAGSRGILGSRPADLGTTDYDNLTADVIAKYQGVSLESMFFWRKGKRTAGAAVDELGTPVPTQAPRNGWGVGAQLGYVLPWRPFELAARYNAIRTLGSQAESSLRAENEVGVAASYYIARHTLKVQADWARYWGEGAAGGAEFGSGEELYRAQLQAAF